MRNSSLTLLLLVLLLISPASAAIKACLVCNSTCNTLPGSPGPAGPAATINVNWTFTGAGGTAALVTNIGSTSAALLDFTIPEGVNGTPGTPGTPATVAVNTTLPASNSTPASVVNVGTPSAVSLDFTIPEGATGAVGSKGDAATVGVNETFTLPNSSPASVTNVGTPSAALLDFGIPTGQTGAVGDKGDPGTPGTPATVDVNATLKLPNSSSASVVNIGTTSAALLDFGIPEGPIGAVGSTGTPGTPATIDVNYTFTGAPGTNAVITNIGTTQDALLDVTIPAGAEGSPGTPGADATVTVNATFTAPNGTPASVVNIGTPGAVLLDITIPEGIWGAVGDPGTPGTPATVAINATFQVSNTTPASVVNIGTPSDVLLDVFIPEGITGSAGSDASVPDQTQFPFLNGSRILTGIWNFGGYNISNVGNPIVSTDAATWGWVVSQISSALMPYDTIANQSTVNASIQSLIISVNNTQVANVSANNASMKNYVDTVNATGITDHGQLTGLTDDDHTQYLPVSLSRAVSGSDLARDVTNSNLKIYGGTSAVGAGAYIALFGKTSPSTAGYIRFYANNADGDADLLVMYIRGGTDTPYLHMNSRQIKYLLDPTAAQDAATMHYVEYPTVTASAQANALCYNTTTKRVTYNSGLTTCLASAEIMKTNITYLQENYTSQLMQLKPVYYTSEIDGLNHYGLLAEDVVKVVPELAAYNEQGGLSGVRYEEFTALLLKGFQEQMGNSTGTSPDMSWNSTYPLLSGVRTLTGKWNFGGFNASNIGNPITNSDAATRGWTLSQINSSPASGSADMTWNLTYALLSGLRQYTGKMDLGKNNVSNITSVTGGDAINLTLATAFNNSMRDNVSANFVPMVANKTPPINLGSGTADSTTYLRGDQTWASPAGGSDPTAKSTTLLFSDFYDPGVDNALPGLAGLAISSGTAAVVATTVDHPGVIYMRDSTTANGGYKYGCVGTQLIGGGETFEVVFQPVGVRAGQNAQIGWSDTAAARTLPVDGVYFNISTLAGAISLRGNTSSNSVRSGTTTAYTMTTATWYRGTIAVNAAGNLVTYTLYNAAGSSLWTATVATNIPTGAGRDTSPCIIVAEGSTDAAADIVRLDYVKWGTTRTLTR